MALALRLSTVACCSGRATEANPMIRHRALSFAQGQFAEAGEAVLGCEASED
jgi:hypothetical protein